MNKKLKFLATASALLATSGVFAADDLTAIKLEILNAKGYQTFAQSKVTKTGQAGFSAQYGYPVAVAYADGRKATPDLYNGSWRLQINRVGYQVDGNAVVDADLFEKTAGIEGRSSSTRHVALTIAGAGIGVIHGADGRDYVLSVHRLSGAVN